jgi:hypothetical protein
MPTPADPEPILDTLLAAYDRAFARALASPPPTDLRQADAAFARLRDAVARDWPVASVRVDALGLAANDLLDAFALGRDVVAAHTAHARALFQLRVALRGSARENERKVGPAPAGLGFAG